MRWRSMLMILGGVALVLGCEERAPSSSPAAPTSSERAAPAAPTDPRIPPGFDLALPRGCAPRYGQASADMASVLSICDGDPSEVARALRGELDARGWRVERPGREGSPGLGRSRETIEAFEGEHRAARAVIERGRSGITRLVWTQRRAPGHPFHSELEPIEWRRIARAPLPPPAGSASAPCVRAIRAACDAFERAGGQDALDCAMDHRGACVRVDDAAFVERAVDDARERLQAALVAHDGVGSQAAREETAALVRVELLAAKANQLRASAAGARAGASDLAMTILGAEAEGHAVDLTIADMMTWFSASAPLAPPGR